MVYQVIAEVEETNKTDLLSAMDWVETTYGGKVHNAHVNGKTFVLRFIVEETTYANAKTTFQGIDTQFGTKLTQHILYTE